MKNVLSFSAMILGVALVSTNAFAGAVGVAVPEPASLSLLAGGVALAAYIRRRRK